MQSEGGPASREPENEHIIARTFDYESEASLYLWTAMLDSASVPNQSCAQCVRPAGTSLHILHHKLTLQVLLHVGEV